MAVSTDCQIDLHPLFNWECLAFNVYTSLYSFFNLECKERNEFRMRPKQLEQIHEQKICYNYHCLLPKGLEWMFQKCPPNFVKSTANSRERCYDFHANSAQEILIKVKNSLDKGFWYFLILEKNSFEKGFWCCQLLPVLNFNKNKNLLLWKRILKRKEKPIKQDLHDPPQLNFPFKKNITCPSQSRNSTHFL